MVPTSVNEVLGSNLDRSPAVFTDAFRGFTHSLLAIAGMIC
jgi:hypothetical protein